MTAKREILKVFFGLFITLILWSILSFIIDKAVLPNPLQTGNYLFFLLKEGTIYQDFFISLKRVFLALFIAFFFGFPLGLLLAMNKMIDQFISPLIYFFFPLPKIVFLPVFFVLFGINETTRIMLLVFILIFQVIVSIRDGAKNISSDYLELLFTLGAKKTDYLKVYIPFVLPAFFTALRISIGMAIAVLFITENFVADRGLGFVILQALELRNYPEMYSAIILMSFMGFVFYFLTDFLERKICFWQDSMLK